jgi:hypothetical protein
VDQINLEKLRIPTITMSSSDFIGLSKSAASSVGVADLCFVVVPHPFGGLSLDQIRAKADAAFPEILKAATEWKPTAKLSPSKPPYPAQRIKFKGTVNDLNKMFFKKGWSLGLPIVPPTPELVKEILKGTSRKPNEVLWEVPTRQGALTVELLATYAVMAGCKPEYMPVLLAVIEAMSEPDYNWKGATTTTGTVYPLIIVNGPIIKELGFAYREGVGGPGYHPNVSIGYTIALIGDIIGGSKAPDVDKTIIGSGSEIVPLVIAENEDELPPDWVSYAVEKGYKKTDNVVTLKNVNPVSMIHGWSCETGLDLLKWNTYGPGAFTITWQLMGTSDSFILLNPEHAALIAKDGLTKDDVRKYVAEHVGVPFGVLPPRIDTFKKPKDLTPDTLIPTFRSPKYLHIIVTGSPGLYSQFARGGQGVAVSKMIKK